MQRKLTPSFVKAVTTDKEREVFWDTHGDAPRGFGLMVTRGGAKSWVIQYRHAGRSRRMTLEPELTLDAARKKAKKLRSNVSEEDPLEEKRKKANEGQTTLKAIALNYLERHKRLRTIDERRRIFNKLIFPKLGSRPIATIRRSDIADLLDKIEDDVQERHSQVTRWNGKVTADHALAILRALLNWHATRDDDYRSPISRGMTRAKPKEIARTRVLTDDELRLVWRAAGVMSGYFGKLVRFILLTATRRGEAANIDREELSGDEWIIPAKRHKSKRPFLLPLPRQAMAILAEIPTIGAPRGKGFIFPMGKRRNDFSTPKIRFDEIVLSLQREQDPNAQPLPRWTLHDLRRTARTLMSRAGVDPDHAERCLGHVIPGIRGTYDLYEFRDEKRRAFEKLAGLIERILDPQPGKVVPIIDRAVSAQ
jgi:integrase